MTLLKAVPKRWLGNDFWLKDSNGIGVAEILLSSWRERGAVVIGGSVYPIQRQGLSGAFVMSAPDGSQVACAVKPKALRRSFRIRYGQREFMLSPVSAFRRECGLLDGDRPIGAITPQSWISRRAEVLFAQEVPLYLQVFTVWLTLLLWKREAEADASPSQTPVVT